MDNLKQIKGNKQAEISELLFNKMQNKVLVQDVLLVANKCDNGDRHDCENDIYQLPILGMRNQSKLKSCYDDAFKA